MRIIESGFKIIDPEDEFEGMKKIYRIESMARISHRSEDRQTADTWKRFIEAVVIEHGDWSVTEHASATVVFTVNRGITHEMVRHRLFGYTQESTRFVNYSKPGYEASYIPSAGVTTEDYAEWVDDLEIADTIYRKWLLRGYTPQIARDHLPNALAAQIAVTGNLRNWRHAFLMRTTRQTHVDFREPMIDLLEQFKKLIPILYQDIEPNARQIDNLKKAR